MLQPLDVQLVSVLCELVHLVLHILLDHFLDCLHHRLVLEDVVLHPQPLGIVGLQGLLEEELLVHLVVVPIADLSVVEVVLEVEDLGGGEELALEQFELFYHVVWQRCGFFLLLGEELVELFDHLAGGVLQFLEHGQELVVVSDVRLEVHELDGVD